MTRNLLHDAARRAVESPSAEQRREECLLPHRSGEIAQSSRTVLAELEASLEASQRALLARDVAGLEHCTSEQLRLRRSLDILWSPGGPQLPARNSHHSDPSFDVPAFANELRAAQLRVLHLGRVQAALLSRAQRWLRTVSHLQAGLEQNYVFPAGSGSSVSRRPQTEDLKKNKEGDPCRA